MIQDDSRGHACGGLTGSSSGGSRRMWKSEQRVCGSSGGVLLRSSTDSRHIHLHAGTLCGIGERHLHTHGSGERQEEAPAAAPTQQLSGALPPLFATSPSTIAAAPS